MPKKQPAPAESKARPEAAAPPEAAPEADDAELLQDNLQRLQLAAADSYEKLSQTAAQLADQAQDVYTASQDYVRKHPAPLLLGALAVGVLIGLLLGRSTSS